MLAFQQFSQARSSQQSRLTSSFGNLNKFMFATSFTAQMDLQALPCSLARIGLDGCIDDCNEMFGHIFGYEPKELLGQHIDILIEASKRKEHAGMMRGLAKAPRRIQMAGDRILNCIGKTGEPCPVQLGASPVFEPGPHGNPLLVGWYVSAADATRESALERSNRLLAEEAAENNRRILELYKQREGFLQALCHEIRGSLTDSTDLQRLLGDAGEQTDSQELLDKLANMNVNLSASLRKLVDFSEHQTGDSSLKLQSKNVSNVIGLEALELRREFKLTASQLPVQFNMPKNLVGSSDWKLVRSVIHELVAEAINYRSADQIRIIVDLEARKQSQVVHIQLADNGNKRSNDPVKTTSDRRPFKGNELSQELIESYVQLLEGTSRFSTSTNGKQLCRFSFPIEPGQAATEQQTDTELPEVKRKTSTTQSELSGMRVLLVDDDKLVRRINSMLLSNAGARVLQAANGNEAVEVLKSEKERVDLVITDLHMPTMDGFECAQTIRQMNSYKRVGIFALTAGGNQREREQAQKVGIDNFLLKPLSLENLDRCMHSLHRA